MAYYEIQYLCCGSAAVLITSGTQGRDSTPFLNTVASNPASTLRSGANMPPGREFTKLRRTCTNEDHSMGKVIQTAAQAIMAEAC
jgi:hypothetical protein